MNPRPRPARVSEQHVLRLACRLTERDRRIAFDCFEHRVLTSDQLRRLHFNGARAARARLAVLYEHRVLDRFRPAWKRGEGSTPHHWVLDEAGAHIIAAELGLERRELRWRHAAAISVASSAKLTHQVQVNELFTHLASDARHAGGTLREWYGERTTSGLLGGIVTPDGYGVLALPGREPLHLLVELDRGTEPLERLASKAAGYTRALPRSTLADLDPLVLLLVPTPARAAAAERAIPAGPLTPVVWSPPSARSPLSVALQSSP